MMSKTIKCYGSTVLVELIERKKDTCRGKVINIGTVSTIQLQVDDTVLFNYNYVETEIEINGKKLIAIAHWKILGYIRGEEVNL